LSALILDHLRSCPDQAVSPSSVAQAIGHSAGAISNSLRKMAEKGEVVEVSAKPRRYSIPT
jgi:type II secretory pathway component PulM